MSRNFKELLRSTLQKHEIMSETVRIYQVLNHILTLVPECLGYAKFIACPDKLYVRINR
jgi:hypothetical protein